MPVSYAGTVSEHTATRNAVGLFDVSHLGKALGARARARPSTSTRRSPTTSRRIGPGKAQYTLCCNDSGGVIDDLIAYYVSDDEIFLVPNAANTAAVVAALQEQAPAGLTITDEHRSLRRARRAGAEVGRGARRPWDCRPTWTTWATPTPSSAASRCGCAAPATPVSTATSCCRRGTGAGVVFDALVDAVSAAGGELAGLGARDTLRTEMGYPLHGHELSLDISPLQARCGWAIGWKKDAFWGRDALLAEKEAGPQRLLRGLRAVGRGVLRPDLTVLDGDHAGRGDHVGNLLSDTESRHRAGADRHRCRHRRRPARRGRRARPAARVRSRQTAVRRGKNPVARGLYNRRMTEGHLEFTLARNANPASDEVRGEILRDPGFGRFHTDHMVSIDYIDGQGLAQRAGAAVRPHRARPVGDRAALRAGGLRRAQGLPVGGRIRSSRSGRRPTRRGCAPRRAGWPSPSCPKRCSSSRCAS